MFGIITRPLVREFLSKGLDLLLVDLGDINLIRFLSKYEGKIFLIAVFTGTYRVFVFFQRPSVRNFVINLCLSPLLSVILRCAVAFGLLATKTTVSCSCHFNSVSRVIQCVHIRHTFAYCSVVTKITVSCPYQFSSPLTPSSFSLRATPPTFRSNCSFICACKL